MTKKLTAQHFKNPGRFFEKLERGEVFAYSQNTFWAEVEAAARKAEVAVAQVTGNQAQYLGSVYSVARDIAEALAGMAWPEDNPAEGYRRVIALFSPSTADCFRLLDEKPGKFTQAYNENGYWKLRRTRNNAGKELFAAMRRGGDVE